MHAKLSKRSTSHFVVLASCFPGGISPCRRRRGRPHKTIFTKAFSLISYVLIDVASQAVFTAITSLKNVLKFVFSAVSPHPSGGQLLQTQTRFTSFTAKK